MNDALAARPLTIAIDGPAGAGKSTVARRVAQKIGGTYVDTGAMYRAVAWAALRDKIALGDTETIVHLAKTSEVELRLGDENETQVWVNGENITDQIRTPEISNLTSPVSAIPGVRHHMAALQREMGKAGGVVMEGRDIGTVVLPDADIKIFLTASLEKRAERRQSELAARNIEIDLESLRADIEARDIRDGSRDVAPMTAAPNAVILNADCLSVDEVVATILRLCSETSPRND